MKQRVIFFINIFLFATPILGQRSFDFGLAVGCSLATQVYSEKGTSNGKIQNQKLSTNRIYLFGAYKNLFEARIRYQQKGFQDIVDVTRVNSSFEPFDATYYFQNRANYLSCDILFKRNFDRKRFQPVAFAGIEFARLINEHKESVVVESGRIDGYFENPQKSTIGLVAGLGFRLNKLLGLELEVNHDLNRAIDNEVVWVKNLVWSVSLPITISGFLRKG